MSIKKKIRDTLKKSPMATKVYRKLKKAEEKQDLKKLEQSIDFTGIKEAGLKIWVFGANEWHANPKAIYLYMAKFMKETHKVFWLANTQGEANRLAKMGFEAHALNSEVGHLLLSVADVYVTENFRETYPESMNPDIIIFNTWHGVGLKHIELGLNNESVLFNSIMKKTVRNYQLYKENMVFLATSEPMAQHFINDTVMDSEQIIKGGYPRNFVYQDEGIATYDQRSIDGRVIEKYNQVILFAPTYRIKKINGVFSDLLPNVEKIVDTMESTNSLFIFKVHPFMKKDPDYINILNQFKNNNHVLFWNDSFDIYEFFENIDVAIVDYSSIYYDLLAAGVEKFIRYVPDFEEYTSDSELILDYEAHTSGLMVHSFEELIDTLVNVSYLPTVKSDVKAYLFDCFYSYQNKLSMAEMINEVDKRTPRKIDFKELHSFDIFDTLIRRSGLTPVNVFFQVQERMKLSELAFTDYFINDYVRLRMQTESDLRDAYRKTTYERDSNRIEIMFTEIFDRMAIKFNLSEAQKEFLLETEFDVELEQVEPRTTQITEVKQLLSEGHQVILISDMYLPQDKIAQMITKADPILGTLDLFVSSEIGLQKSTGELYKYVFSQMNYDFSKWIHHGDNNHADGNKPRELGIKPRIHDMDKFLPFESKLVESSSIYKPTLYQVATKFQRYRQEVIASDVSTAEFSKKYYSMAYIGMSIVPYVNWALKDAIAKEYDTLYFISRDGHYLKMVADELIKLRGYHIKTKYIYGSRKAWRIPSFIDEVDPKTYGEFGSFVEMDSFDDVVRASQLTEYELLAMVPELKTFRNVKSYRGNTAVRIREILKASAEYNVRLLNIAAEKRVIVRQYLQENIDFDEKFAFVEFWGRGYTQETFTRLLADAAGHEVVNPFYYVRSISFSDRLNVRHNFSESPSNYSYFEPIFASTPYRSIKEYRYTREGSVEPVIEPAPNEFNDYIEEGLKRFVQVYADITEENEDAIDRIFAKHAYGYHFNTPWDQFICENLGEFKDSINSYGEPKPFAPALTEKQVKNTPVTAFGTLSGNMRISLAKSNDAARKAWVNRSKKDNQMPKVTLPNKMSKMYPVNDLELYWRFESFPVMLKSKGINYYYDNINFEAKSKTNEKLDEDDTVIIEDIYYTHSGIPRLKTKAGFLTARRDHFSIVLEQNLNRTDTERY